MSQMMKLHKGSTTLILLSIFLFACNSGKMAFKESGAAGEKASLETPPDDLFPTEPTPTEPPQIPPTEPPVVGPVPTEPPQIPPTEPTPIDPVPPEIPSTAGRCGVPANSDDYTPYTEIAKSQSSELFGSYAACQSARAALFGNSMVCSKMVSATILGCLQTADYQHAAMELDLALPILKATGKMETPYDYFMLDVPNCVIAAGYINTHMGAQIPTAGQFTSTRAEVHAECSNNGTDLRIHVIRTY